VGGKIHDEEKAATCTGLEDLSAQSFRRHCVDGFVRGPDHSFRLLYGFLILRHSRHQLLWSVTARLSAHWIAWQLTEAYDWQYFRA